MEIKMVKKIHQEKMIEQYVKDDIFGQIARHFMETGKFDPFSAKLPDTSVHFEEIREKLDDNEVIYRFFPYKYFEQLLDEKQMAFISPLVYDDDEKEAECFDEYKNEIYKNLVQMYDNNQIDFNEAGIKKTGNKCIDLMNVSARWQKIYEYCRRNVFVSCWTFNDHSNAYMWKQYTKNAPDAVAIKTTIGHLKQAIEKTGHGRHALGKVKYIDWQKEKISFLSLNNISTLNSLVCSLLYKQKRFENDNEFRLVIDNLTCNSTSWVQRSVNTIIGDKDFDYDQYFLEDEKPTKFLKETIIPDILIDEIYLSPYVNEESLKKIRNKLSVQVFRPKNIIKSTLSNAEEVQAAEAVAK